MAQDVPRWNNQYFLSINICNICKSTKYKTCQAVSISSGIVHRYIGAIDIVVPLYDHSHDLVEVSRERFPHRDQSPERKQAISGAVWSSLDSHKPPWFGLAPHRHQIAAVRIKTEMADNTFRVPTWKAERVLTAEMSTILEMLGMANEALHHLVGWKSRLDSSVPFLLTF